MNTFINDTIRVLLLKEFMNAIWINFLMRTTFIVLFLLFAVVSHAQTSGELLERIYKAKSKSKLSIFFIQWNKEMQTVSDIELSQLDDIKRAAYKVFIAFYKPLDPDCIGGSEYGKDFYKNADYLVVQNYLNIYRGKVNPKVAT